jgi:ABC-type antimicrobial peptide transport system permease subunit
MIEHAASAKITQEQLADENLDVFTRRPFDETTAETLQHTELDMASLLDIDGDILSTAFVVDASKIPDITLDAIDPSTVGVQSSADDAETQQARSAAMSQAMANIMTKLISDPQQGYLAWMMTNPGGSIEAYLNSPSTTQAIHTAIATDQVLLQLEAQEQQTAANYIRGTLVDLTARIQDEAALEIKNTIESMRGAMTVDGDKVLESLDLRLSNEELAQLLDAVIGQRQSSLTGNLALLGYADRNKPTSIDIYPNDYDAKEAVIALLDEYNSIARGNGDEDKVVSYSDNVGAMMDGLTSVVNMVSAVLVGFVSISLVVSSVMIGVITYVSVLERRKEIGILRAIGAARRDIRRVFEAESLIVGFIAGVFGVAMTVLLCFIANIVIQQLTGVPALASLPWQAGLALVGVSMLLTLVAGLVPALAAARKDPVEALRNE